MINLNLIPRATPEAQPEKWATFQALRSKVAPSSTDQAILESLAVMFGPPPPGSPHELNYDA